MCRHPVFCVLVLTSVVACQSAVTVPRSSGKASLRPVASASAGATVSPTPIASRLAIPSPSPAPPQAPRVPVATATPVPSPTPWPDVAVVTLAGSTRGYQDGVGSLARFHSPSGVAVDATGTVYVADTFNHRIRRIAPSGEVSTLAGSLRGHADGTGTAARFNYPMGVAVDTAGTLYVADSENFCIRKVTPTGQVTTLAGDPRIDDSLDGTGTAARFGPPVSLTVDAQGGVHVVQMSPNQVRYISPATEVTTLRQLWKAGAEGGQDPLRNAFDRPFGMAVGPDGTRYVSQWDISRVFRVTAERQVTVFAGDPEGFVSSPPPFTKLDKPCGLAMDRSGTLYLSDAGQSRLYRITPEGAMTVITGGGTGAQDGDLRDATFRFPVGIAVDTNGNLYVADRDNHRIRKIRPSLARP